MTSRRREKVGAIAVAVVITLVLGACAGDEAGASQGTTKLANPTQTPAAAGGAVTGPAETGPTYNGPTYTLGPVTKEDIAVGEAFMQAWVDGDGEAAAAMFSPEGTFDGVGPAIFPALHDWFRAGGWTFESRGCFASGGYGEPGAPLDVLGCGFTYENDLIRALGMQPADTGLHFVIDAGRIETAWFGAGGDCCYNMFGSPDPVRIRAGGRPDLFAAVWDMFIEWLSTSHAEDFERMYDPDYGYPVRGYPILDPASIELWERYTDEFVASPQELARSFTEWLANQSFEVQAGRICMTATAKFWATKRADHLSGAAFNSAMADVSEETLAELRALPLETEADRATMDQFVPLAERWIEHFRGEGPPLKDLQFSLPGLIPGCLISGLPW